jgi:RNA polymerase sigma-70 factor (ECF subfamily)
MLFHAARLDARLDDRGCILLLEDQDRSKWDRRLIRRAMEFLDRAAEGTAVSPFHLEAGIALCHCSAQSYAETDWPAILRLYDALLVIHRSPIYLLNRAIVVSEIEGPQAGLRALADANLDAPLERYHLYDATLGELHRRAGQPEQARRYFDSAKRKTRSRHDREVIERRAALVS